MPVARKVVVLSKSVTPKRIEDNIKVIRLDAADVKALDEIHKSTTTRFVKVRLFTSGLKWQMLRLIALRSPSGVSTSSLRRGRRGSKLESR